MNWVRSALPVAFACADTTCGSATDAATIVTIQGPVVRLRCFSPSGDNHRAPAQFPDEHTCGTLNATGHLAAVLIDCVTNYCTARVRPQTGGGDPEGCFFACRALSLALAGCEQKPGPPGPQGQSWDPGAPRCSLATWACRIAWPSRATWPEGRLVYKVLQAMAGTTGLRVVVGEKTVDCGVGEKLVRSFVRRTLLTELPVLQRIKQPVFMPSPVRQRMELPTPARRYLCWQKASV